MTRRYVGPNQRDWVESKADNLQVEGEEGEEEEEDDDLATAFEILDLARVCYLKLLNKPEEESEESREGAGPKMEGNLEGQGGRRRGRKENKKTKRKKRGKPKARGYRGGNVPQKGGVCFFSFLSRRMAKVAFFFLLLFFLFFLSFFFSRRRTSC